MKPSRALTAVVERSPWISTIGWLRVHVLPVAVLTSWLTSRLFVDLILVSGGLARSIPLKKVFSAWDGNWYLQIAREGFTWAHAIPADPNDLQLPVQTPFPFFPLFPLLLALGRQLGVSRLTVGLVIGHLALLVGLALTHALVRRLSGNAAANWCCWFLAFSPGSVVYSMLYPEGLLLVCSSGAFLARSQGRWALASLLAALATLARPNGLAVALALAGEACLSGSGRQRALKVLLPSLMVLLLWSGYLMVISGNPLIWVQAKQAWREVTLFNLLASVGGFPWIQFAAGLVALVLLLLGWGRQPWGWRLFGLLWIAPSFFLGMVGFPRYAGACFPVFASLGEQVVRLAPFVRFTLLSLSVSALALQTVQVGLLLRWIP